MKTAVQLYNFRNELGKDFRGTLKKIAGLGVDGVEFAGDYGKIPPLELAGFLSDLKLECAGTMFAANDLLDPGNIAWGYAGALRTPAVTISAFIDFAKEYGALRETCIRIGQTARSRGTVFSYHNHWLEFTKVGRVPAMELILRGTSPEEIFLEPDVCWLTRGGMNPADYLKKYAKRIRQIHMKDITVLTDPDTTTELGRGVVDLKSAYRAARKTVCEWLIYEQDFAKDPFACAEKSIAFLKKLEAEF